VRAPLRCWSAWIAEIAVPDAQQGRFQKPPEIVPKEQLRPVANVAWLESERRVPAPVQQATPGVIDGTPDAHYLA